MNIYLIGYRGCGKSSIAPLLAEQLAWECADADNEIELLVGKSIAQIFKESGEAGFREWETSVVMGLAQKSNCVVALGGGAPLAPENQAAMKRSGCSVWLKGDAKTLWSRIMADEKSESQRPALTQSGGLSEVEHMLKIRQPVYKACADYVVDVGEQTVEQLALQIANWWDPVDN